MLFLVHLFDTNIEPQMVTINTIFGAGTQGPYQLESVLGDEAVVSITADNNQRKRILVVGETSVPIQRDIAGDTTLYITSIGNQKVLLESTYRNEVSKDRFVFYIFKYLILFIFNQYTCNLDYRNWSNRSFDI